MIDTDIIDGWLLTMRGKTVDIIIAGRIFGGRPGEAPQLVKGYEIQAGKLVMYFGTTEILIVEDPDCVRIDEEYGELIIPHARNVLWGWHYYGRDQVPENWCTEEYSMDSKGNVRYSLRGPIAKHSSSPNEMFQYSGEEMVRLSII